VVAEAIAAASADPQTAGRILHLCSGPREALRMDQLKPIVRAAYARRGVALHRDRVLPRRWYARLARLAAVFAPPRQRRALATLPIYLDYLADRQAFDDSGFRAWLAARGQTRPPPASYIGKVLDYYLDAQQAKQR